MGSAISVRWLIIPMMIDKFYKRQVGRNAEQ